MTERSPRQNAYVPYLLMREHAPDTRPVSGWDGELRLPYVAFMQRWQGRWSRFWEDGGGTTMTAFDFMTVLRDAFVVRTGGPHEREVVGRGEAVAARLNELEDQSGCEEARAVADCKYLIDGWPSWAAGDSRVPLFVAAHNFDAWNYHEPVWREMRRAPVRFVPIPSPDVSLLNRWLFERYRFPKHPERFERALQAAAGGDNRSPKALVAEGMQAGLRNAHELLRLVVEPSALSQRAAAAMD